MVRTTEHVILLGLLLLSGMRPVSVVDPAYPPNVLAGGTVIATSSVNKGSVEGVTIVSGDEPFAGSVMAALKAWRFSPEEDGQGHPVPSEALAVCVYRFPVVTPPAPR